MKKTATILMLIFVVCVFSAKIHALDWYTANQVTIGWDAWLPIQQSDLVSYYVYVKFADTGEILGTIETPNGMAVQETAALQSTITLTAEGKYYFGIATKRVVEDGTILISDINWSDVNGEFTPNPFGVKFYVVPEAPKGLMLK